MLALAFPLGQAHAWGATGHEYVSGIAVEILPEELPAFLRAPGVAAEIAVLGRELDRSKGSGNPHDAERDTGHFVTLDDDGTVRGLALDALPPTREAYDTALRERGSNQYLTGYLPYAIVDGWQQVVKDFAYWRAGTVAAGNAVTAEDRAWFASDLALREQLLVRDLGVWSHFIADATQPLHVSVHDNRRGDDPKPIAVEGGVRRFHARYEGAFVRSHVERAAVARAVAPYRDCGGCGIDVRMRALLLESQTQVMPLFELETRGAFAQAAPEGIAFTTARLAHGAGALRDMIVDAWRASAGMKISWPEIAVSDVEAGRRILKRLDFGDD